MNALAGENPELPIRWKLLLDFLGTFRQGGRKPAAPEPKPPTPEAKSAAPEGKSPAAVA